VVSRLPAKAEKLVIQGDLSITSLGPLSAKLHRALDMFSDAEDLGLASRFRLSPLSVSHALESGMSIAEIEGLLQAHVEKLPQPIAYLLDNTVANFGTLKVVSMAGGCLVMSADQILLQQILNQQNLRPLLLSQRGPSLFSKLDAEMVYFNLRSEGYTAVRCDEFGNAISPREQVALQSEEPVNYLRVAERLLSSDAAEPNDDDVLRQLQFAMRNKLQVGLRVAHPDGSEREHLIEPLGLAGTRVRGRDAVRQAEVTLPLAKIIAIWLT
jgi:hypothetical protein